MSNQVLLVRASMVLLLLLLPPPGHTDNPRSEADLLAEARQVSPECKEVRGGGADASPGQRARCEEAAAELLAWARKVHFTPKELQEWKDDLGDSYVCRQVDVVRSGKPCKPKHDQDKTCASSPEELQKKCDDLVRAYVESEGEWRGRTDDWYWLRKECHGTTMSRGCCDHYHPEDTGRRISLDMLQADLSHLLRIVAEVTNTAVPHEYDPNKPRLVSVRAYDCPWQTLLRLAGSLNGFSAEIKNGKLVSVNDLRSTSEK